MFIANESGLLTRRPSLSLRNLDSESRRLGRRSIRIWFPAWVRPVYGDGSILGTAKRFRRDGKIMAKREYTLDELTVLWDSDLCVHCHKCDDALPLVFDPTRRPWVKMDEASSDEIIRVVNDCPSGAISVK